MSVTRRWVFFISLWAVLAIGFNNCNQRVSFEQTSAPSNQAQGLDQDLDVIPISEEELNDRVEQIQRTCRDNTPQSQSFQMQFPAPSRTCEWGVDGNLMPRDRFFQARIEQAQAVQLPAGAVVCDIDFDFPNQSMRYDDHMMLTLNGVVMASTIDFSHVLSRIGSLLGYSWSNIAGISWESNREGVFCLGSTEGLSQCQWPKTDVPGRIQLNYQSEAISRAIALFPNQSEHFFKVVSFGDNDDFDCEHSDMNFSITVNYVIP